MECIPVGFVFLPSDQELVEFLIEKIEGGADHHEYYSESRRPIFEWDLYGKQEPWDIWKQFGGMNGRPGGDDDDEDLYLFTKLKKESKNGSRISRKVGSGTWSGAYSETICASSASNIPIALKKHFRYESEERPEHDGAWIMHEFSLYDQEDHCSFVLCRLRKKTKKNNNNKFHHHHHHLNTNTNTNTNVKKMRLSSDHIVDHDQEDLAGNNNNNNSIYNIQHEAAVVNNNNNNNDSDHHQDVMFSFAEIEALMFPDQEAKTTTIAAAGHDDDQEEAIAEIEKFLFSEEPAEDIIIQDNQFLGNWDDASFGEYFNGNHPSSFGGF